MQEVDYESVVYYYLRNARDIAVGDTLSITRVFLRVWQWLRLPFRRRGLGLSRILWLGPSSWILWMGLSRLRQIRLSSAISLLRGLSILCPLRRLSRVPISCEANASGSIGTSSRGEITCGIGDRSLLGARNPCKIDVQQSRASGDSVGPAVCEHLKRRTRLPDCFEL